MDTKKEELTLEQRQKKAFWRLGEFVIGTFVGWVCAAVIWDVFDLKCLAFVMAASTVVPIVLSIGVILIISENLEEGKKNGREQQD